MPAWPNEHLIGVPDGRRRLDTPALLLDLPAMTRNIARMASLADAREVALRPHVKTHKSLEIARRQIAAGAVGVSCVTLGEAEMMAGGGIAGVLITSPVVTPPKIDRLIALAARAGPGAVMVVVDHPANLADLARAAARLDHRLDVLVDYAAGYHRTGVASAADALSLAAAIAREPKLRLRGLQAYAGNIQHIQERASREAAATALGAAVAGIVAAAAREGVPFEIVTGGGTGSHDIDSAERVFTELQVGSYVFMDVDYGDALRDGYDRPPFETALFVQTAVVSINAPGWVTTDGGVKCFATDGPAPRVARGADPASRYALFGDEHGKLFAVGARPVLGARIELVTPHCDPTVNLHDAFHVVEDGRLVAIWPVDARGRH